MPERVGSVDTTGKTSPKGSHHKVQQISGTALSHPGQWRNTRLATVGTGSCQTKHIIVHRSINEDGIETVVGVGDADAFSVHTGLRGQLGEIGCSR